MPAQMVAHEAPLIDPAATGAPIGLLSRPPDSLTRAQRVRRFGVDCVERLEWPAGWEPGGEYTKELVLKNMSSKVMRLKYKLPDSKYFSMAFPETIKLMPGLSKTLQARLHARAAAAAEPSPARAARALSRPPPRAPPRPNRSA